MGNQVSSGVNEDHFGITGAQKEANSKSDKKTKPGIISNEKKNSVDSGIFKDNISSYKGVKTDQSCTSGLSLDKESTNEVTDNENGDNQTVNSHKIKVTDVKDQKVPTRFEWKEGGNNVYLTGTFCNWNQKFLMSADSNKFELILVSIFYKIIFCIANQFKLNVMMLKILLFLGFTTWHFSV
jgi:hypothetical protein